MRIRRRVRRTSATLVACSDASAAAVRPARRVVSVDHDGTMSRIGSKRTAARVEVGLDKRPDAALRRRGEDCPDGSVARASRDPRPARECRRRGASVGSVRSRSSSSLPVAVVTTMFVVGLVTGPLAHDFKNELYPQAEDLLAGRNPWPRGDLAADGGGRRHAVHAPAADGRQRRDRARRARLHGGGALARRRPRLARLRRRRPLAAGARRHPHRAPDAAPLPARRRRLALPRPAASRPASASGSPGA